MKQVPSKILIHQQNNTFSNRNNSIRLSPHNSERPETQNSIRREINAIKQGQAKIVEGQAKIVQTIVQGQATIVTELRKMSISIDNLSQQIGRLAQINNNGNNSKKSSLNQSFSDFSKHSSGTAIYVRRNEAKKYR